jgi:transcriptional regulator
LPMYIPHEFSVTDREQLLAFVQSNNFATLVTCDAQTGLTATHVPLLVDPTEEGWAVYGHIARANPQPLEGRALVIFSGPHAYVSPTWYTQSKMVPTWDYVAVHVSGICERIEDSAELKRIVQRLTLKHEASMPNPWRGELPPDVENNLLQRIVGFRVMSEEIRGAWKLHQHHSVENRRRVASALRERGSDNERLVAELIERTIR